MTRLPRALFGLTILAWGNCLGDMSADVAMTKKGYGEMAITGTMAGPIFNILVGQGAANTIKLLGEENPMKAKISVSVFEGDVFNTTATLPLSLILAQLVVLAILLLNAVKNQFDLSFKYCVLNTVVYGVVLLYLVVYCLLNAINPPSD